MKPDWSKAPSWAKYLAMDQNGTWFWYEFKPKAEYGEWIHSGGACEAVNMDNWKNSLEKRP